MQVLETFFFILYLILFKLYVFMSTFFKFPSEKCISYYIRKQLFYYIGVIECNHQVYKYEFLILNNSFV